MTPITKNYIKVRSFLSTSLERIQKLPSILLFISIISSFIVAISSHPKSWEFFLALIIFISSICAHIITIVIRWSKKPRTFTRSQKNIIISALKKDTHKINIIRAGAFDETHHFAKSIIKLFVSAGWDVDEEDGPPQEFKNGIAAVSYHYHVHCVQSELIKKAFSQAGITIDKIYDKGHPQQAETVSLFVADNPKNHRTMVFT